MRIGVAFGGKAVEHPHSVKSALYILASMERGKDEIHALYFAADGRPAGRRQALETVLQTLHGSSLFAHDETAPENLEPHIRGYVENAYRGAETFTLTDLSGYDVIFPLFHGQNGEDGLIQGILEMLDVPYVGCDLLSTVVANDKDLAKRLVRESGLSVADFASITTARWKMDREACLNQVEEDIGFPMFVKPAGLGSSIGVRMVPDRDALTSSLSYAFRFGDLAIVEEALVAREFGVGVIGLGEPRTSLPLEFGKPENSFLDYEAKYGPDAVADQIPASIDAGLSERLTAAAASVWRTLRLSGMSRVDFFVCADGRLLFNEVNTVPGFGPTSVFSRIWRESGIPIEDLIGKLIDYGLERQDMKRRLLFTLNHAAQTEVNS